MYLLDIEMNLMNYACKESPIYIIAVSYFPIKGFNYAT